MPQIPANTVTVADVQEWYTLQQDLNALKLKEHTLRLRIFGAMFPDPKEGTNTLLLEPVNGHKYALKGSYVINRKIDDALLTVMSPAFREKNIPVDSLIKRPPELVLSLYRTLTDEERQLFDQVLEIKPGSPSLKIEEVKR